MGYQKWSYELLHGFCMDAFEKFGFTEAEANIIQDVLLTADLYGIESHGMQRMVRYHKCIEKGMIHVDAKPEVVFETPVSAVVDGHDGMGQLIGHFAMELAIEKAKKSGVGILFVGEDLDVMMALCDKIMVLCHGRVMGVVHAHKVTKEELGLMMTGALDLTRKYEDKPAGIARDTLIEEVDQ